MINRSEDKQLGKFKDNLQNDRKENYTLFFPAVKTFKRKKKKEETNITNSKVLTDQN